MESFLRRHAVFSDECADVAVLKQGTPFWQETKQCSLSAKIFLHLPSQEMMLYIPFVATVFICSLREAVHSPTQYKLYIQ
jgi:hypothetical protein